ncbi:MAG: thrombospondin type 3 repeat-containing protein, partial [Bacteroidales bacterium]|nr:thrombospondin type 3 repeat-containing protein [Bacteroidales bacterium]
MENTKSSYPWRYTKIGGVTRVSIETGDDIAHLPELDQKQWTVLSCPTTGLEIDSETLKMLDTDGDGVPDYMDNCSETPKNVAVDSLGCPKDSDGDGVADYMDKCPQLAGDSTGNGCPEIKEKDKQVLKKSFTGIVFQVSKSVIKPSSYPTLNEIAKVMKE